MISKCHKGWKKSDTAFFMLFFFLNSNYHVYRLDLSPTSLGPCNIATIICLLFFLLVYYEQLRLSGTDVTEQKNSMVSVDCDWSICRNFENLVSGMY